MGKCNFVEEKFSNTSAILKGTTAFAEKENACIKDTGIYLPPAHAFDDDTVDVIFWFHGFYVENVKELLHPASAKLDMSLREALLRSEKNAILVAPWLGLSGNIDLGALGQGDGCQAYLEGVLDGIARLRKSLSSKAASSLGLGNLIIAGHSAGGAQMREASRHLGRFQGNLKECWGFDCFYDDLYSHWARENNELAKYFYFGNGSGGGGLHAFKLMKEVYGTPKKPIPDHSGIPNMNLAPAVDRIYTPNDDIAFESIEDIRDWNAYGPNLYRDVRKATDPYLDDVNHVRYWNQILPRLTEHFQVVRDLFGPRIKQSSWL
jgi:hypothetical protein